MKQGFFRGLTAPVTASHQGGAQLASHEAAHGRTELGAARAPEPGYGSKRSHDGEAPRTCRERRAGCRRERPAQGHGQPRAAHHAGSWCRLPTCTYMGSPEQRGRTQVGNLCYWGRTSRLREWLSLAASRQSKGFRCPTGCRSRHRLKRRRAADRRADARARHHKACSCCGSPAAQRAPPHPDR